VSAEIRDLSAMACRLVDAKLDARGCGFVSEEANHRGSENAEYGSMQTASLTHRFEPNQ
jgi:hypothetical protein